MPAISLLERLRKLTVNAFLLLAAVALPAVAPGDGFELLDRRVIPVQGEVLDLEASADGQWTFVLTSLGKVAVYDAAGGLVQTIDVDRGYNRLEFFDGSNRLLLGGTGRRELIVINLAMRYDIDTAGSPHRGPQDAPVTIAVYSDFQ
jgi:hypothetical protein